MSRCGELAAAVVLAAVLPAGAQQTTGAITGFVADGQGRPLSGATVQVTHERLGVTLGVTSRTDGHYVAILLPPGLYDLAFAHPGHEPFTVHGVFVHVNDRLIVNAVLGTIAVDRRWQSGDRAAQANPTTQSVVTARQIEALPLVDRSFVPLTTIVPGVTSAVDGAPGLGPAAHAAIIIGGMSPPASGWFLDGAPLILTPTLESVEEVRVIASVPSAEWPAAAVVSLVTKSGTNTLRASAYELHRNDALDANAYLRNSSVDPALRAGPAPLRQDTFGYTAGGPIRENATFFFVSQEWRRRRGESATFSLDTRQVVARLDHHASPRWRFTGRYSHDLVEEGPARAAAHLLAIQVGTAFSATTRNELSYRLADGDGERIHVLADDLSFQRGTHTLKVGGLVADEATGDRYEAYAQDWWRLHRKVTADLGLRYSEDGAGPGVGLAWSADESTAVRGAFGIHHAPQEIRQWTVGLGRRLYQRGTLDLAYAGSSGEASLADPEARYHGLLAAFRHEGGRGLLDLSYTLGRHRTLDGNGEWGSAAGDRTHVVSGSYVLDVRGWRIAGITTFQSGPPGPPIVLVDAGGVRARPVSDPFVNLPSDRYYFSPAAFAPPAPGAPAAPRSPFRLPGRNQWDLAVSRTWPVGGAARVQLRADVFNLFNHTQFTRADARCTASLSDTTCAVPNTTLGQYTATRPPRQVQLGVKVSWN